MTQYKIQIEQFDFNSQLMPKETIFFEREGGEFYEPNGFQFKLKTEAIAQNPSLFKKVDSNDEI